MNTPPTPTLEQEAQALVRAILELLSGVQANTFEQAVQCVCAFALRQKGADHDVASQWDKDVEESLKATILRYQDEIQTQLRHERLATARRCAEIAADHTKGFRLDTQDDCTRYAYASKIAEAIHAEFGLTAGS